MAIPQIDGRRRRSERSREAIVQSILDLVGERAVVTLMHENLAPETAAASRPDGV